MLRNIKQLIGIMIDYYAVKKTIVYNAEYILINNTILIITNYHTIAITHYYIVCNKLLIY